MQAYYRARRHNPIVTVSDTQILTCSGSFATMLGYRYPQDIEGRYLSELLAPGECRGNWIRYAARKSGHQVERDYTNCFLGASGDRVYLRKHTEEIGPASPEVWETWIETAGESSWTPPPKPDDFGLTMSDVYKHNNGFYNYTEAASTLIKSAPLLDEETDKSLSVNRLPEFVDFCNGKSGILLMSGGVTHIAIVRCLQNGCLVTRQRVASLLPKRCPICDHSRWIDVDEGFG